MNKTRNYNLFGKVLGNRPLHEGHLKRLEVSILESNLLYANPIIVTKNHDVVDGQHRLEVARNNNLEIYYIKVSQEEALRLVRKLNTHVKGWNLENFVDSNIELGLTDYQILKDFAHNYGLAITNAIDLLQGGKTGGGNARKHYMNAFKEGGFKVKGLKNAIKLAEALVLAKPFVGNVWKDRNFLRALHESFDLVGVKKMIKQLESSRLKVVRQAGTKEYLRNLEEIYNFHKSEKNRVRFF